jgi:hypothetical protein
MKRETVKPIVVKLDRGLVRIYEFTGIRLHAYATKDPFEDQCFLFETNQELVGLESPLFKDNLAEYSAYIKTLNKPLKSMIVAYHPSAGSTFSNARIYATEAAKKSYESGGPVNAMIKDFSGTFGDKIETKFPKITNIIKAGTVIIGGIDFIVKETKEGFDLEIPSINVVYTHMVGAATHNILDSIDTIDGMIHQMQYFEDKKPRLILSTHDTPASAEIASKKKGYLKTVKLLAQKSKDKDSFITNVKAAFPDYTGEHYLEMSAGALFPEPQDNKKRR